MSEKYIIFEKKKKKTLPPHILVFAMYCFPNNAGIHLSYTVCDNFLFTFSVCLRIMKYLSLFFHFKHFPQIP